MNILQVKDLEIAFTLNKKDLYAVKKISFELLENEILGIVGESGSGKSTAMQSLVKLLPSSAKCMGEVIFENQELLKKPKRELFKFRGKKIAYIFQNPMTSLNPSIKIGKQILEILPDKNKILSILQSVKIKNPKLLFSKFPFELSGGQKQRALIAMAIAMKPKILIADEPTTALDVSIQSEVLTLLKKMRKKNRFSIILISHDLHVVSSIADRILVMYAGKIVEEGFYVDIINTPKHPYTKLLLKSIPKIIGSANTKKLKEIPGKPLDIFETEKGCDFASRCPFAKKRCFEKKPKIKIIKTNHKVLCWLYE